MSEKDFLEQLRQRLEKVDVELLSKPFAEQKQVIVGEQWTVHFVSGNSYFDYRQHRDFKTMIAEKSGGMAKVIPHLTENMAEAKAFVEQIRDLIPEKARQAFSVEQIKDQDFKADEPIYVEIVVLPIYGRM